MHTKAMTLRQSTTVYDFNSCGLIGFSCQLYTFHRSAPTYVIPCGLVVRISGFHPGGPGSIPGMGTFFRDFLVSARLTQPMLEILG